jgi:hypothetical protein
MTEIKNKKKVGASLPVQPPIVNRYVCQLRDSKLDRKEFQTGQKGI